MMINQKMQTTDNSKPSMLSNQQILYKDITKWMNILHNFLTSKPSRFLRGMEQAGDHTDRKAVIDGGF